MKATMAVEVVISTDTDQKNILWKEDDDTLNKVIRTDFTVQSSGVATVAAGVTFTVPFGDIATGYLLKISADASVTVKLNGSSDGITVVGDSSYRGLLALHGSFTAVTVTAGAAAANVRYCVAGV
jgi:hypothetical protein